jgi:hypothetical protein
MICQRGRSSPSRTQRICTPSAVCPSAPAGSHGSPSTTGPCTSGSADGGFVAATPGSGAAEVDSVVVGAGLAGVAGGDASAVSLGSGVDDGRGGFGGRADDLGRAEVEEVTGPAVGGSPRLMVGTTMGGTTCGPTWWAADGGDAVRGDPKVTQPTTAQSVA